jgi:hypothetical protein
MIMGARWPDGTFSTETNIALLNDNDPIVTSLVIVELLSMRTN